MERGVEMADGSHRTFRTSCIKVAVCVCVCVFVGVWVSYRKEAQPTDAVCPSNQITERESERDRK